MKRVAVPCLGLAMLLVVAVSGCLFDPEPDDPPPPAPPTLHYPASEDQAIANFKTAYTGRNLADYRTVLSPQYVFLLRPEDVLPGQSDRLTCAEELAVAENMFSGNPIDRGSFAVPAISSISIAVLDRQAAWSDVAATDPDFPNTRRGLYMIQLTFARPDASTIIVSGAQEFYVASRDSVVDGVNKPYFQLRGQRDLTIGSKTEMTSWGGVKKLYR